MDLFAHIMKNNTDVELRRNCLKTTGHRLFDCTLYEPCDGKFILLLKLAHVLADQEEKNFKSKFAKKALAGPASYEDLKEKREFRQS